MLFHVTITVRMPNDVDPEKLKDLGTREQVLDTYTLADLIKPQKALSSLLSDRHVSLRPS